MVLAGGVGLYLAGIAFVDRVNEGTTNDRVLLARLGSVALLVALAALGSPALAPRVHRDGLAGLARPDDLRDSPRGPADIKASGYRQQVSAEASRRD